MTSKESFNRALDLFIESLYKPDHELRMAAKGEGILVDLMLIRQTVINDCMKLRKE